MRNLKKTLSLCLAFVMLFGLMVVGAGAVKFNEYTDLDTIAENRKEAVDLLNALGIMEGTENGSFGPTATLDRDQAAKIVAWANLGRDAKDNVTVSGDPFSDVAKDNWAAPYVTYCKNTKIINGIGDGSYAPHEPVSGFQLGKMLLCVVGYGVNGEYTGGNWNMKVATDGNITGLFKGIENVGHDAITRQDAAQMVFNALTMEMVAYSELYGTYSSEYHNALNPTLLGTKAEQLFGVRTMEQTDVDGSDYHYWRKIGTTTAITESYDCDNVIEDNIYASTAKNLADKYDFAEGVEIWENGVAVTAETYFLGDVELTRRAVLNGTALYYPSFANNTSNVVTYKGQKITLIDEGAKCKYDTVYETGTNAWIWGGNGNNLWTGSGWASSSTAHLTSNHTIPGGSNGAIDKILVTTEYLGRVTSASSTSATATVYAPTADQKTFTVTFTPSAEYKTGDYVLVVPTVTLSDMISTNASALKANDKVVIKDQKAESLSAAKVTAYAPNAAKNKANGSVTTGGTTYSYNGVFANYVGMKRLDGSKVDTTNGTTATTKDMTSAVKVADRSEDTDKNRAALGQEYTRNVNGTEYFVGKGSYTFYLDSNKNVIGVVEENAGIRDFAYIIEVGHDDFFYYNTVKAVLSDGTVGTYTIDRSSDGYDSTGTAGVGTSGTGGHNSVIGNTNVRNGVRPGYMYRYSLNGNQIILSDIDNGGASEDGQNGTDNQTYDAVKDIYDVNRAAGSRATNVRAYITNGNAFTRGGSAFRYEILRSSDVNQQPEVNTKQHQTTKSAWGDGTHVAYATDNTVFTFVYGGANDSTTVARYVGKNSAPSIVQDDKNPGKYSVSMVLRKEGNTNYIEYVVIRSNSAPQAMISENHFTVVSDRYTQSGVDVNNRAVYYYDVILEGVKRTIAVYDSGLKVGDVCTYTYTKNLFEGDPTNNVEVGVYTVSTVNSVQSGVLYNHFVDVDGQGLTLVVKANAGDTTLNKNVDVSGARVWDLTDNGKELTPQDLAPTQYVTVIYSHTNGSGENLVYIATEVYILSKSDEITLNDYREGEVTRITGSKYINPGKSLSLNNKTIGESARLYVEGNATGSPTLEQNARLTVSGTLTSANVTLNNNSVLEVKGSKDQAPSDVASPASPNVTATVILGDRTYVYNGSSATGWTTVVTANDADATTDGVVTLDTNVLNNVNLITVKAGATLRVKDDANANIANITLEEGAKLVATNCAVDTPAELAALNKMLALNKVNIEVGAVTMTTAGDKVQVKGNNIILKLGNAQASDIEVTGSNNTVTIGDPPTSVAMVKVVADAAVRATDANVGTLTVSGTNNTVTVYGTVTTIGGNTGTITVSSNVTTIAANAGKIDVKGTVTAITTNSSTITIEGAVIGTLTIGSSTGTVELTNASTTTPNTGTVKATGNVTLSGTIGAVEVTSGNLTVSGTLKAKAITANTVTVPADTTLTMDTATGNATITGNVEGTGNLNVTHTNNSVTVTGSVSGTIQKPGTGVTTYPTITANTVAEKVLAVGYAANQNSASQTATATVVEGTTYDDLKSAFATTEGTLTITDVNGGEVTGTSAITGTSPVTVLINFAKNSTSTAMNVTISVTVTIATKTTPNLTGADQTGASSKVTNVQYTAQGTTASATAATGATYADVKSCFTSTNGTVEIYTTEACTTAATGTVPTATNDASTAKVWIKVTPKDATTNSSLKVELTITLPTPTASEGDDTGSNVNAGGTNNGGNQTTTG